MNMIAYYMFIAPFKICVREFRKLKKIFIFVTGHTLHSVDLQPKYTVPFLCIYIYMYVIIKQIHEFRCIYHSIIL